ncbi:uncharacterized protein LOC124132213 [Haliotis rufescens]|uniref:uncharacterized protein LOC124132213 n=1 Tax=Haliotis rufescens TaxID=6454 RepID=UPI00201F1599|nr:uncharacterized protein LOC124132213 [Haliotis rufescens]
MVYLGALVLFLLYGVNNSTKVCTKQSNYHFLHRGMKLPGKDFVHVTTEGVVTCARTCLITGMCKSFNFNTNNGQCELNYATLTAGGLNVSHLVAAAGLVFSDIAHWPQKLSGACAYHNCTVNTYCKTLDNKKSICSRYVIPTSCAEVKACEPSSTDGEYWLRLLNFDLYRTRIYCHNMSTANPVEFLTLPTPNYGVFPNVSNAKCNGETPLVGNCVGNSGEIWYNKIRVAIQTMDVVRSDTAFAVFTNLQADYAQAMDCYSIHHNGVSPCGTKGEFIVNLLGTGWVTKADQQWKTDGWMSVIESVTPDDTGSVVRIKCGGLAGFCHPDGPMILKPYPEEDTSSIQGTEVRCLQ